MVPDEMTDKAPDVIDIPGIPQNTEPPVQPAAPPLTQPPPKVGDTVLFLDQQHTVEPVLREANVETVIAPYVVDLSYRIGDSVITAYGVSFGPKRDTDRTWSWPTQVK